MISERGYMARNLDVLNAHRLEAELAAVIGRMKGKKRVPGWLRESVERAHNRAGRLIRPLVEHRDELAPDPRDVRGFVATMLGDEQIETTKSET